MGNIVSGPAPALLPGFDNDDLDPSIIEAVKAFTVAHDRYTRAVEDIEASWLLSVAGRLGETPAFGDPDPHAQVRAQLEAVRALRKT